jgi:hypothetical protein
MQPTVDDREPLLHRRDVLKLSVAGVLLDVASLVIADDKPVSLFAGANGTSDPFQAGGQGGRGRRLMPDFLPGVTVELHKSRSEPDEKANTT